MAAELRLILLGIGVVGVLCLWWWEFRRARVPSNEASGLPSGRFEPRLDADAREAVAPAGAGGGVAARWPDPAPEPAADPDADEPQTETQPIVHAPSFERPVPHGDPPVVTLDDLPDDLDEVVLEAPDSRTEPEPEPEPQPKPAAAGTARSPGDRRQRVANPPVVAATREPTVSAEPASDAEVDTATGLESISFEADLEAPAPEQTAPTPPRHQRIVAIRLLGRDNQRFEGKDLKAALTAEGLEFGRYSIYHRVVAGSRPLFSVASLVEPGSFDLATMESLRFPGISLFAVFPGPLPAPQCFDDMLSTARRLADRLSATLHDDMGSSLTGQRVLSLREDLVHFEHLVSLSRTRPQA
jgi:cell division protein ZipA